MEQNSIHLDRVAETPVRCGSTSAARGTMSVVAFAALVALGAQVRVPVPWSDVPMTLQVLAVMLAGFLLPLRQAVGAMALYLACGAAGLPVFAAGSGGLLGSTGGYLAGFVTCAWIVGTLAGGRNAGLGRLLLAASLGYASVFALGIAWRMLIVVTVGGSGDPLFWAVVSGTAPFLVKAVVEVCLAVGLVIRIRAIGYSGR